MLGYALKILLGDRLKYIGLILALSFAAFIISQQSSIFVGIMRRTCSFIIDTSQPDIWVMNPSVQYVDDLKGMKSTALYRVRGIEGVEWAVPMYKGSIQARLESGKFQTCVLIGIDDATLIGGPPSMVEGSIESLRFPDAVIINQTGAQNKLSTTLGEQTVPMQIGQVFELNDRRAYVSGICYTARTFQSQPVVYTTYNRATTISPQVRDSLTFILVKAAPGQDVDLLCKAIREKTGYAAYTSWGFQKLTMMYYVYNTGIVVNFGVAILLGFIIGVAIAGQTFFNFISDNLPYFGTLKAMGASNKLLMKMVVLQALFVGSIGFGIGIGCTALFGFASQKTELSFSLPFWLYALSGFSLLVICFTSALFSVIKVMRVDPAIVFRR
jgi:putative ABC transport system permease protein